MERKEDILYYDFQGWPIYKMTLREFIEDSGLFNKNEETGNYELSINDEVLDAYPIITHDDGMGYGAAEEFISEAHVFTDKNGKKNLIIFSEGKDKNLKQED